MHQVLCPVVVGRDEELAVLNQAVLAALDRRGQLVVISGESGIGKSRLARSVEEHASELGMVVVRGRAVEGAGSYPFRPIAEAIRSFLRSEGLPRAPMLEPFRPALGQMVPELAEGRRPAAEFPALIEEAVIRLLQVMSAGRGCLVVLEDLHWADADTLDLLQYLADNLSSQRLLCLCTERSNWPGPASDIFAKLVARRAAMPVALDPLSDDDVEAMARLSLEVESLPDAVTEALHKRAEGVPFLVEEMLSAYVASGSDPIRMPEWVSKRLADALPNSYRELVRSRLANVDEGAHRVVNAAAVLGRTFDWPILAPITELAEADVLAALREAITLQLLAPARGIHADAFSFRHALVRETILSEMLPPERADVCNRAAEVIEEEKPGLPGEWCELAADLFEQAGDNQAAVRLLQESARRALARSALSTAESTLRRSRELVLPGDWALMMGIDELLVEVLFRAGKTEKLIEFSTSVITSLGTQFGKVEGRTYLNWSPPWRQSTFHLRLARAGFMSGNSGLAANHLARTRELAQGSRLGEPVLARAASLAGQIAVSNGNWKAAASEAERALESATNLGLKDVMCEAFDTAGRAAFLSGDLDGTVQAFEQMLGIADENDLPVWRVKALVELGTIDQLCRAQDDRLLDARELARSVGAVSSLALIDLQIGWNHLWLARLGEASESIQSSIDACLRFELRLLPHALVAQASLFALQDKRDDLDSSVAKALDAAPGDREVEAGVQGNGFAVFSLCREKRALALEHLDKAVAILGGSPGGHPWWIGLRAFLHTFQADGDSFAEQLRSSDALSNLSNRAYLGYSDAVDLGRRGRGVEAAEAFARADGLMPPGWRRHHVRRLVAENALEYGWGDPKEWIGDGLKFFEGTPIHSMSSATRSLARRSGIKLARRGRGASKVPSTLRELGVTSREMDVMNLVGEGLSNTEIAEHFFLSARTVETHVASLMRKTSIATRPQLVALAARHRPNVPA